MIVGVLSFVRPLFAPRTFSLNLPPLTSSIASVMTGALGAVASSFILSSMPRLSLPAGSTNLYGWLTNPRPISDIFLLKSLLVNEPSFMSASLSVTTSFHLPSVPYT